MRATWLTDIHLNFLRPLALQAFYDRVAAEQPDAVLATGDIGEADNVVEYVEGIAAATKAPVYFVLGNHDYYRSSIKAVRDQMRMLRGAATWLPAQEPILLTPETALVGIDGWGDGRCGDPASKVKLSDWKLIEDFRKTTDPTARLELLQRLGANEARALRDLLARVPASPALLVLTHVPPFPEACIYAGEQSDANWLPWFTCIATGQILLEYARAHPGQQITVLCGHSHGLGTYEALPNLVVRTGGWPAGVSEYGNPIVQSTLTI